MENRRLILRILRIFFQGYRLITAGLKREIDAIEKELNGPAHATEAAPDKS
jgi:hypothetical protein